jgi:uncharacterized protein YidB (DUF937 family)
MSREQALHEVTLFRAGGLPQNVSYTSFGQRLSGAREPSWQHPLPHAERALIFAKLQKDIAMGLLDSILGGIAGNVLGGSSNTSGMAGQGRGGGQQNSVLMALLPIVLSMLASRGGGPMTGNAARGSGLGGLLGTMGGAGGMGGSMGGAGGMGAMSGLGGLGALLELFQQKGYGEQVQSWVGTGQNKPIAPEALSQIFGGGQLTQIASQAGVSEDEARMGLAALLPQVVDQLTPQGQLPEPDQLSSTLDDFARQLQRT